MIHIEYAMKSEMKQVRDLWECVFPEDSREFLDFYFSKVIKKNRIVVAKDTEKNLNSEIIAMLHMNPYMLEVNKETVLAEYIVAVATHPEYRRQGIMRRLMEFCIKECSKEKDLLVLVPEDERYYSQFGFKFISMQYNTTITSDKYKPSYFEKHDVKRISSETAFYEALQVTKKLEFEPVRTYEYSKKLFSEVHAEGGHWVSIHGYLIAYYLDDLLEIRSIYMPAKTKEALVLEHQREVIGFLLTIAGHRKLLIHEVNKAFFGGGFEYVRSNQYDQRPYMMYLSLNEKTRIMMESNQFFFNEVI